MTAPDRTPLLDAALHAVSAAAIVTRAVQRDTRRGKIDKHDGSPVTIADFAAQAVIVRELSRRLGAVQIVAEESSAYLRRPEHAHERRGAIDAARQVWTDATEDEVLGTIDLGALALPDHRSGTAEPESFWTIDPIDGTKGFIRGHQYAVCLAYIERGVPVVGALACPNLSEDLERPFDDPDPHGVTLLAADTGPATWRRADQPGAPARPLEHVARTAGAPLVFCESWERSHSDQTVSGRVMDALRADGLAIAPPARIDSQCKYAVVARGQIDVFLRRSRNSERRDWIWDHAPGWLIATRAGASVTDALGHPHDFSHGRTLAANRGVLAARPDIHAAVLTQLTRIPMPTR